MGPQSVSNTAGPSSSTTAITASDIASNTASNALLPNIKLPVFSRKTGSFVFPLVFPHTKEPVLTSPARLNEATITPEGEVFDSNKVKAAGMVPSWNKRLPLPSVMG